MSSIVLDVAPRSITGKEVKNLRRDGVIPGVIYGPLQERPIPIQVEWSKLRPVLSRAGGTSLIDVNVDNQTISVLVREVHRHPYRAEVLHVDFYAVNLEAKIKATIPVTILNLEAEAKRLAAKVFQPVNRIMVECLPADLPSQVQIDLSILKRAGQNITVGRLPQLKGVSYLADEDVIVIRTVSLMKGQAAAVEDEEEDGFGSQVEVEVIKRGKGEEEEF